jgi:hypothetical protein
MDEPKVWKLDDVVKIIGKEPGKERFYGAWGRIKLLSRTRATVQIDGGSRVSVMRSSLRWIRRTSRGTRSSPERTIGQEIAHKQSLERKPKPFYLT